MTDLTVPHFDYPIRMAVQPDGTFGVDAVEQDSLEEILACVNVIGACPVGAWIDQPSFGVPSQVFAQAPLATTGVTQAIARWEPRAVAVAREFPDEFDAATRNIAVSISTPQQDQ